MYNLDDVDPENHAGVVMNEYVRLLSDRDAMARFKADHQDALPAPEKEPDGRELQIPTRMVVEFTSCVFRNNSLGRISAGTNFGIIQLESAYNDMIIKESRFVLNKFSNLEASVS
jgi:hypothetical protein